MALPGRAVRAAAPPPGRHRSRESNLRSAHCTEGAVRTSPWPRPAAPGTPPIAPGPRPAPSGAHGVLAKRGPAGTLHVATAAPTVLQPLMCPQHRAADASSTTGARGPGPPNDAVKRRLVFQPLRHDPGLPCSPAVILGTLDEAGPAQVRGYLGTSDGNGAVGGTAFPEPHDCGAIPVAFGTDWAAPLGTAMNSVCSTIHRLT